MKNRPRTITVGQIKATLINIGNIHLPLAKYLNLPDEMLQQEAGLALQQQTEAPIHAILLQLPHTTLLVDAGLYDMERFSEYALPDYSPPPSLVEQLNDLGVSPEQIEQVIITHRHWDHFNGTTVNVNGSYQPQFPHARYHLSRIDWERSESLRNDPTSVEYQTLRILDDHNVLTLTDAHDDFGNGVQIIAAPGETRGHQIVRVHSAGETLYCLGDLYHHPIEFLNPAWMVSWARPETTLESRKALLGAAVQENALLVATHIPEVGRVKQTATGYRWEAI